MAKNPQPTANKDSVWSALGSMARVALGRSLTSKVSGLHTVAMIGLVILVIVGTFFYHWLPILGIIILVYLLQSGCKKMDEITTKYPLEALEGYERVQYELGQLAFKHGRVPTNMTLITSPSQLQLAQSADDTPDKQAIVLDIPKDEEKDEPETGSDKQETASEENL